MYLSLAKINAPHLFCISHSRSPQGLHQLATAHGITLIFPSTSGSYLHISSLKINFWPKIPFSCSLLYFHSNVFVEHPSKLRFIISLLLLFFFSPILPIWFNMHIHCYTETTLGKRSPVTSLCLFCLLQWVYYYSFWDCGSISSFCEFLLPQTKYSVGIQRL